MAIDKTGFVSPFPQSTASLIGSIEVRHVPTAKCLHALGQRTFKFLGDQQVHLIFYKYVGVYLAVLMHRRLILELHVASVVLLLQEARLVVVAALNDMPRIIDYIEAGLPRQVEAAVGEGQQLLSGGAGRKSVVSTIFVGKVF
ncbi:MULTISPECIES: hypothetical protein [Dyella]|uniref:hypothetical protein n=1 Tax=Dyella TaxID=231454 RepID=UPI0013F14F99|nr:MULTISPECIES: hypothetical protein [Dyella]